MIGSVFEQRDQLAALERRRQEVAAASVQAQATGAITAPASQPGLAGLTAGPAAAAASMAVKASEPDIAKRRNGRERGDRKGHDLAQDEAATGALDEGRGYIDAQDDEASRKTFRDRGITEGPGRSPEPGRIAAEQFDRDFLEAGHAAESPVSGAPRQHPFIHAPQGYVQPIELPGALVAAHVPAHVTQAVSMGSPSERAR